MTDPGKIAQRFLNELNESDAMETLLRLMEVLENKPDPEMTEVRLCDNIYQFVEKLKTMEFNLRSYVQETQEKSLPGNKLASLWEDIGIDGSIYRD